MKVAPNRFNGLYGAWRAARSWLMNGEASAYDEQLLENRDGPESYHVPMVP